MLENLIIGAFMANAFLIIIFYIWNRSEARADVRDIDKKLDSIIDIIFKMKG